MPSWVHPSWEPLRAGATLGFTLLVAILGAFSELLGRSGEPPRASWQPLLDSPCWVPSWVHSGSSWDDLRATSNIHLGSHFGIQFRVHPGSSWGDLGSHLGYLGSHFGIHLVGCHLGCILEALGTILGATSGILGATLGSPCSHHPLRHQRREPPCRPPEAPCSPTRVAVPPAWVAVPSEQSIVQSTVQSTAHISISLYIYISMGPMGSQGPYLWDPMGSQGPGTQGPWT